MKTPEPWDKETKQIVVPLPQIVGEVWMLYAQVELSPMTCVALPSSEPFMFAGSLALAKDADGGFLLLKPRRYVVEKTDEQKEAAKPS